MIEPDTDGHAGDAMAYDEADHLPAVRAFACSHARRLGLTPQQVASLAIAVSELAINTLQHTSGGGTVRVWAADGQVTCDVIDSGPMRAFGRPMPAAGAHRGRGLAIVERVCDQVSSIAAPHGTVVRLRFTINRESVAT